VSGAAAQAQETIAEIRVHGNHTTPDADVISISGLTTGADASEAHLRDAEQKLKSSDRFDNVEVRRRFRSIDNPSDILVVILVEERAGISADDLTPGPLKRFGASAQWLPVLNYADGYGMTYGVRVAFADVIGNRKPRLRATDVGRRAAGRRRARTRVRFGTGLVRSRRRIGEPARQPVLRALRSPAGAACRSRSLDRSLAACWGARARRTRRLRRRLRRAPYRRRACI
jgi:hypothetical protein